MVLYTLNPGNLRRGRRTSSKPASATLRVLSWPGLRETLSYKTRTNPINIQKLNKTMVTLNGIPFNISNIISSKLTTILRL